MIDRFDGPHRFLSNFWSCKVVFENRTFQSVEHAYVFAKATPGSLEQQLLNGVIDTVTAGQIKKLGKIIPLRENWNSIRIDIMRLLLRSKFTLNDDLRIKLLHTENSHLVEGNTWGDVFWGVCNGTGQNNLGKLLMELRDELAADS